jgi:hypothetical protein
MNHLCGLCVDNGAWHTLEILTTHGSTGKVIICASCIRRRFLDDLDHELYPSEDGRSQRITGFTVSLLPQPTATRSMTEAWKSVRS